MSESWFCASPRHARGSRALTLQPHSHPRLVKQHRAHTSRCPRAAQMSILLAEPLAAGNAVAFLPQSRDVRTDAVDALFGPDPGTWIDLAILSQAGMSFVFLFLIGLGLRNRFRL